MTQQIIDNGTTAGDGTGESLFDSFDKVNSNFTELYDVKNNSLFVGRTAAEAGDVPTDVDSIVVISNGLFLHYERDGSGTALTTGDGATWSPAGLVYPDHWEENATPGTTSMSTAINTALSEYDSVNLGPLDYYVDTGITISTTTGKSLVGAGIGVSTITTDTDSFDIITITASGTSRPRNVTIRSMTIEHTGSARTSGAHIKAEQYPLFCFFEELRIVNVYIGFDMKGAQKCFFRNVQHNGQFTGSSADSMWNFDVADASHEITEIYISDCDSYSNNGSGSGLSATIRANKCDGIFISNCHFFDADYHLYVEPDAATNSYQDTIASIVCSNTYFDRAYVDCVNFTGNATAAYRGLLFTNCHFMRSQGNTVGTNGNIVIDTDDLSDLQIVGGRIYGAQASGIVTTSGNTPTGLRVINTLFFDNAFNGSGADDIYWDGSYASIVGTVHQGGDATGSCIQFGSNSSNNEVVGVNTGQTTMGSRLTDGGTNNDIGGIYNGLQILGNIDLNSNHIGEAKGIAGSGWVSGTITSGDLDIGEASFVSINPGAPVTITDISASFPVNGIEIVLIRNSGSDATFQYNASKLRTSGGVDSVVGQYEAIMFVKISGSIWQQIGL